MTAKLNPASYLEQIAAELGVDAPRVTAVDAGGPGGKNDNTSTSALLNEHGELSFKTLATKADDENKASSSRNKNPRGQHVRRPEGETMSYEVSGLESTATAGAYGEGSGAGGFGGGLDEDDEDAALRTSMQSANRRSSVGRRDSAAAIMQQSMDLRSSERTSGAGGSMTSQPRIKVRGVQSVTSEGEQRSNQMKPDFHQQRAQVTPAPGGSFLPQKIPVGSSQEHFSGGPFESGTRPADDAALQQLLRLKMDNVTNLTFYTDKGVPMSAKVVGKKVPKGKLRHIARVGAGGVDPSSAEQEREREKNKQALNQPPSGAFAVRTRIGPNGAVDYPPYRWMRDETDPSRWIAVVEAEDLDEDIVGDLMTAKLSHTVFDQIEKSKKLPDRIKIPVGGGEHHDPHMTRAVGQFDSHMQSFDPKAHAARMSNEVPMSGGGGAVPARMSSNYNQPGSMAMAGPPGSGFGGPMSGGGMLPMSGGMLPMSGGGGAPMSGPGSGRGFGSGMGSAPGSMAGGGGGMGSMMSGGGGGFGPGSMTSGGGFAPESGGGFAPGSGGGFAGSGMGSAPGSGGGFDGGSGMGSAPPGSFFYPEGKVDGEEVETSAFVNNRTANTPGGSTILNQGPPSENMLEKIVQQASSSSSSSSTPRPDADFTRFLESAKSSYDQRFGHQQSNRQESSQKQAKKAKKHKKNKNFNGDEGFREDKGEYYGTARGSSAEGKKQKKKKSRDKAGGQASSQQTSIPVPKLRGGARRSQLMLDPDATTESYSSSSSSSGPMSSGSDSNASNRIRHLRKKVQSKRQVYDPSTGRRLVTPRDGRRAGDDPFYLGQFPPRPLKVSGSGIAERRGYNLETMPTTLPKVNIVIGVESDIQKRVERDQLLQQALQEAKLALRAVNTKLPSVPSFGTQSLVRSAKTDLQRQLLLTAMELWKRQGTVIHKFEELFQTVREVVEEEANLHVLHCEEKEVFRAVAKFMTKHDTKEVPPAPSDLQMVRTVRHELEKRIIFLRRHAANLKKELLALERDHCFHGPRLLHSIFHDDNKHGLMSSVEREVMEEEFALLRKKHKVMDILANLVEMIRENRVEYYSEKAKLEREAELHMEMEENLQKRFTTDEVRRRQHELLKKAFMNQGGGESPSEIVKKTQPPPPTDLDPKLKEVLETLDSIRHLPSYHLIFKALPDTVEEAEHELMQMEVLEAKLERYYNIEDNAIGARLQFLVNAIRTKTGALRMRMRSLDDGDVDTTGGLSASVPVGLAGQTGRKQDSNAALYSGKERDPVVLPSDWKTY